MKLVKLFILIFMLSSHYIHAQRKTKSQQSINVKKTDSFIPSEQDKVETINWITAKFNKCAGFTDIRNGTSTVDVSLNDLYFILKWQMKFYKSDQKDKLFEIQLGIDSILVKDNFFRILADANLKKIHIHTNLYQIDILETDQYDEDKGNLLSTAIERQLGNHCILNFDATLELDLIERLNKAFEHFRKYYPKEPKKKEKF